MPTATRAVRRPPGQADLPGAADRGERRARRLGVGAARAPSPPWPSAAGSPCWPTTRWRTGWSSRCWPPAPRTARPRDLPVVPPGLGPQLRLLTRGAQRPDRGRGRRQSRAASARLRAAERIAERRDEVDPATKRQVSRVSALWAPSHRLDPTRTAAPRAVRRRPGLRGGPPSRPPAAGPVPVPAGADRVFGLGMAGLLMLNTTLQNQAFQARALNRQATELAYVQAELENRLDAHAAPAELARRASALGMRPNPHPAFLVLPEGKVDRQADAGDRDRRSQPWSSRPRSRSAAERAGAGGEGARPRPRRRRPRGEGGATAKAARPRRQRGEAGAAEKKAAEKKAAAEEGRGEAAGRGERLMARAPPAPRLGEASGPGCAAPDTGRPPPGGPGAARPRRAGPAGRHARPASRQAHRRRRGPGCRARRPPPAPGRCGSRWPPPPAGCTSC